MAICSIHWLDYNTREGNHACSEQEPYSQVFAPFLCGMFAFLDLYCTQPLLPMLSRVFQSSEANVSLTISASTLGVALSALLLALFAESVNRKRMIVGSMFLLAVATLLTATATNLATLAAWRFLQGLVTPGIFIITIAYVTEEWTPLLVPRVMSFYVAGTVFGGFAGRLMGGLIAPRFGWRLVFVVLGGLGLAGALLTQRLLRPAQAHRVPAPASRFAPVLRNLRNPRLLATFAIGFCMLFALVATFSYITFYLAAAPFHLSTEELSYVFAVYLFGLLATLLAGTVLARIGLRSGMMAAIVLCMSGVGLTLVPSLWVIALGLAATGSGVFVAQTCANSFLRDAAPAGGRVSAAGMYICSYYIGGTVGGILPGLLWRYTGWPGVCRPGSVDSRDCRRRRDFRLAFARGRTRSRSLVGWVGGVPSCGILRLCPTLRRSPIPRVLVTPPSCALPTGSPSSPSLPC